MKSFYLHISSPCHPEAKRIFSGRPAHPETLVAMCSKCGRPSVVSINKFPFASLTCYRVVLKNNKATFELINSGKKAN